MAASGLVGLTDAAAVDKAINLKVPLVRLIPMKAIFPQTLEKNGVRNGSDIAKCLEKLNSLIPPKDITEPYGKINSHQNNAEYFRSEIFHNRLGRSPSTDSIAVSNFSSDQGSVDSCHYSSNGSDSNSVSSPSSPEEPDPCSRAGSPHSVSPSPLDIEYNENSNETICLREQGNKIKTQNICPLSRTVDCSTCGNRDSISFTNRFPQTLYSDLASPKDVLVIQPKESYLYQSNNLVPNSSCETFQSSVTQFCVPPLPQNEEKPLHSSILDKFNSNKNVDTKSFKQTVIQSEITSLNSTSQSNCSSTELQHCNWSGCDTCVEGNAELVEHIRCQHVQIQMDKESYVCLWIGCKVFNKPSCSLSWLERHILCHGGNKPFKCIVDNCSQCFPTQSALQRHVNSHFDSSTNNNGGKNGRCRYEIAFKNFRKKKHLKYKRKNITAKTEDFFDANIMEQIRYKLIDVHSDQSLHSTNNIGALIFHSKVKAIRTEKSGEMNVLLHWMPENILPDSWVSEKYAMKYKRISFSSLPPDIRTSIDSLSNGAASNDMPRVKHRRK